MAIQFLNTVAVDTDVLYVDTTNNRVGIGTANPDDGDLQIGDSNAVFNIAFAGPRSKIGYNGANTIVQGGTSKGVAFCVNNSTLGSGEVMRVNTLGLVGIGTTSPAVNFQVGDGSTDTTSRFYYNDNTYTQINGYGLYMSRNTSYIRPTTDNTKILYIGASTRQWNVLSMDASTTTFNTNGSENMRINSSGNVGIGTSSPTRLLHVAGASASAIMTLQRTNSNSGGSYGALQWTASDDHTVAAIDARADGDNEGAHLLFHTTSAATSNDPYGINERMRITSNGNVGIGTTNPTKKLDVNGRVRIGDINYSYGGTNYHVLLAEDSNDAYISNINGNAIISGGGYYYGSNLRLLNSTSTSYSGIQARADGNIAFENATGGTAGSTIAVSEKMRVSSNGNVGIGTTNPAELLTVSASDDVSIRINSTKNGTWTADQKLGALEFFGNDASGEGAGLKGYVNLLSKNTFGAGFDMTFGTTDGTNGISERMRVAHNGNVGINITNPGQKLDVVGNIRSQFNSGDYSQIESNGSGGVIKALSSGSTTILFRSYGDSYILNDLGIGVSSPDARLHAYSSGKAAIIRSLQNIGLEVQGGGNGTDIAIFKNTSGTERFSLNSSGQMFNLGMASSSSANASLMHNSSTGLIYRYTSSIRYKEDVKDLTNAVDKIMKLRPVEFKPKDSLKYTTGMIAEEVFEVMPEITFEAEVEGFDTPQVDGISYEPLHAYYIKAIQELSSKIESLETRIQTLENN